MTIPDGHCHFLGGVVDPADPTSLDRAVAERAGRGVDLVKVMASGGFLTPGSDQLGAQFEATSLQRLVAAAHGVGLRVVAHTHSVAGAEVALDAGVDGLEHFTCLAEGGAVPPPRLLERIAAAGVTVDPTLGNDPARFPPVSAMPPHVLELLAGGWPVEAALAMATSVAADDCGVEAGRLAAGRLADLLVVDGEVATDVRALSRPVAVWVGGVRTEG